MNLALRRVDMRDVVIDLLELLISSLVILYRLFDSQF